MMVAAISRPKETVVRDLLIDIVTENTKDNVVYDQLPFYVNKAFLTDIHIDKYKYSHITILPEMPVFLPFYNNPS